ncbi:unnamed protein product [Clonostachys rhizophaga]|uniref:Uncharacterized protein n=1 Tax=Clonostachys rhizophaga TaxID=160324 RepID=A0A9N9YNQ2_9HYPO|nr:unnamed protein product [Clonostachys rhizophaga]
MDKLPVELLCMIGENLTSPDLASFSRASRTHWQRPEPLLYRLHALRGTRQVWSALARALEFADREKPELQAMPLITLGKVARFCKLEPALLDRCRSTSPAYRWLDSSTRDRLRRISVQLEDWPSMSPLHVAALKGLDDIAAWLLSQGASVDALMPGTTTTALSLAILGEHTSTALLLLANGADPELRESAGPEQRESERHLPTVLHLACALGLAELADRLLSERSLEAQPTELLATYRLHCPSDVPRLAAGLVRRGAEVSEDTVGAFLRESRWQSAWELLTSPTLSDQLTAEGASRGRELARRVETAVRMLQHLLSLGADPDLGRLLWRSSGGVSYPTLLKLLPPLLEAGMDVKPAPPRKRRRAGRQPPVKYGIDDLLGYTSPYDKAQDDEGAVAQLAIIRLLLQHGAPIGGATRGDALDSFLPGPGQQLHGRERWSYELTKVLLRHCNNTLEDMRGEDIKAFMSRYSEVQGRTRVTLVDGL